MCGRFESKRIEQSLIDMFNQRGLPVEINPDILKRSEEDIRPTEKIISVLLKDDIYNILKVGWGIKFAEDSPLIINSRLETIKEKKYWTSLMAKNKCVVPMTGFYEWQTEGKKKTKYKISIPELDIFFVPALYTLDKNKNITASLITTVPNKFIEKVHHRMPVIFDFDNAISFLNDDTERNLKRCLPYDDKKEMAIEIA